MKMDQSFSTRYYFTAPYYFGYRNPVAVGGA
jgi:hypothetical protein